jgi:AraC family transcriptional regulator
LERVLAFVDAHLDGELTLTKLADIAAMSPFHFLRSFRLATGATPGRFVRTRRFRARTKLARIGR